MSKYSCVRINKNILEINSLFFYENKKFRPQGGPFVYIPDFFEGVKVKFFRFISKQIPYLVSLNTLLVLESVADHKQGALGARLGPCRIWGPPKLISYEF